MSTPDHKKGKAPADVTREGLQNCVPISSRHGVMLAGVTTPSDATHIVKPRSSKARQRAAAAARTIVALEAAFPSAFAVYQNRRRPLKVGIHLDLAERGHAGSAVRQALGHYAGNVGYLKAMQAGAARVDLDGQPAGEVTEAEAEAARQVLVERRADKRRGAKRSKPTLPAAPPPKQRLSLADLRAAAQARKNAATEMVRV